MAISIEKAIDHNSNLNAGSKDKTSELWDQIAADGDAEEKLWGYSTDRAAVLRDNEVVEEFPSGTDWDVLYNRMKCLMRRRAAQVIILSALAKGLIGFRKEVDDCIKPEKKPSIMDITRGMCGG